MSKEIAEVAIWMVESYYAGTRVKWWNTTRFYKLCHRLRCHPKEMAALLRIEDNNFNYFINADRFSGAVSLHFEIIERWLDDLEGLPTNPVLPVHLIMHAPPESERLPAPDNNLPDPENNLPDPKHSHSLAELLRGDTESQPT